MRVLMVTCEWPSPNEPHIVPFIVRQVEFLRRAGVDIDVVSFRGAKNPLNYLRAWYRVQKKFRRERYDLVHAQWGQSAPTALPTRLPLVVTFRGGEGEGIVGSRGHYTILGQVLRAVSALVARRANELVVVSSHMRRYVPRRRVHVVPSGLDFSKFVLMSQDEARRRLGLKRSKRFVLFVGNPDEVRKRYGLAKEVVSRLDPRLRAELVVAWRISHDLVPIYMNACDVLLFVSMYEGSPNVIKEALACNLPIVSLDVGDVSERLKDVGGCRVCSDDNPDHLAEAVTTILLKNRRLESRATVLELDEALLAQRMIQIYRLAMTGRHGEGAPQLAGEHVGSAQGDART